MQVTLDAQLVAGPASTSDTGSFPSGTKTIPFGLNPATKQYQVDTGNVLQVNTAAPSFHQVLDIGTNGTVTQGLTLYCRCTANMKIQTVNADPAGGSDITNTIPIAGVFMIEYPSTGYLKQLSVQGAGQFEYWCSGTQ